MRTKLYAGNINLPGIEDAINQIKSASQADTQAASNIVSNLQCFDTTPVIQSQPVKEIKQHIAQLQQSILSLEQERLIDEAIGTISQPYIEDSIKPTKGNPLPTEILNPDQ